MANIKAKANQVAPNVTGEGDLDYLKMTKLGQLFTANWQTRLVLAGRVFSLDLGAVETYLAGNHDVDQDQPEFIVAVDSGWLIPISLNLAVSSDCDADADSTEVLVIADRTQAATAAQLGTVEVPNNLLDGGDAFGGRASSVSTGTCGTVTEADILYAKVNYTVLTTEGHIDTAVNINHEWTVPRFLKGPCQILGYCVGVGDAQTTLFIGSFVFAHLPASWIVTS